MVCAMQTICVSKKFVLVQGKERALLSVKVCLLDSLARIEAP